jgi:saccharopine dehydrogenase-like NADP-dependent oxidoreductase
MKPHDVDLTAGVVKRVDFSYLNGNSKLIEDCITQLVKSMRFLGFYEEGNVLKTKDQNGKPMSCLDSFSDVMAQRMRHTEHDRDLVVMRHNFIIENQKKERWLHTSTWIESGMSHASGGFSLMSKSVGVTAGIGARLVLEGKINMRGVVTPMYADIYDPILKILEEKYGIAMIEESERLDGLLTTQRSGKL